MNAARAFDADAAIYDRSRRQLIPCFDEFYCIAVEQAPQPRDDALRVLDLGAGTGLLSSFFAAAYPRATFTLVDLSPEMLARAERRFAHDAARFGYVCADHSTMAIDGSYDLIVSALSIHHLPHDDKRALFHRSYEALVPGGAFINADQVLGPTPERDAEYRAAWMARTRELGVPESDLAAAIERMKHDITATEADQVRWLREAGFADADCVYRWYWFGVFSGRKR